MPPSFARNFRLLWSVLLAGWIVFGGGAAQAAGVTVRANFNRRITVVGEAVQYQIKVTGAKRVTPPAEIEVDGLRIRYAGTANESVTQFNNGVFTSERIFTLTYLVDPEKNGTFTIPAVTLEADGRAYRTEPVALTVQTSVAAAAANDSQTVGFAELVVPKRTAYIGEAIPVEFRLYVDARVRWQAISMPEIAGEGFTKLKMPEPPREEVEKNGREYFMMAFKTAISPSRAGKITLGPIEVPFNARVPRARKGGPQSLFDMFDDDIFGSPQFSAVQTMKAKAAAFEITVKPLPADGKPADFSGAVGNFQFTAEGSPKQVKVGDPLTMQLRVTGRGSFDRMSAPVLQDAAGWRTYPPSNVFKADDEIGYSGTKTFEMAVVPETKKTAMPVFQFTYFDVIAEKYVTLKSEPTALAVEGGAAPVAPPKAPVSSLGGANASAPPAAAPVRPDDILGPRYDPHSARDQAPLDSRREFWYAQGGMCFLLLVFLGVKLRRHPDTAARVEAGLRREKAAALARLRSADLGHVDFFETAARVAQIETALATGHNAGSVDAAAVRAAGSLSDESTAVIDEIFSSRAELLYAGGGRREGQVSAPERERVLGALRELEKSHGRS